MTAMITVALAGNPNSGKTTLFNVITGARHHVGNWPGKTVERRSGSVRHGAYDLDIVDLPGAYSLSATSPEEILARDYLIDERPDVVVIVVDASHLERNLFLATQILEFGTPAVLALNMTDVADAAGITLDLDTLAARLGVPVVALSASKRIGVRRLLDTVVEVGTRAAA